MADSVATVTPLSPPLNSSDRTQKIVRAYFSIGITAGDYVTGGLPLDLSPVTGQLPVSINGLILSKVGSEQPAASANTSAWVYQIARGTDLTDGTLQIFGQAASAGLTEISAGATPAGIVADVIVGYADFQMGT